MFASVPIFIQSQVLSGKPPWSEIGEDVAVVVQLYQGRTPARPESRQIDDQYWELIEHCLSPAPNRPAANAIGSSIEDFLGVLPRSQPLRDVMALLSSQYSRQSDSLSSSFSTSPGDEVNHGLVRPDRYDQHASE